MKYRRYRKEVKRLQTEYEATKRPINVKAFGAIGDGLHDDGLAIQAAIDFAARWGGSTRIPGGTYITTTPIVFGNLRGS